MRPRGSIQVICSTNAAEGLRTTSSKFSVPFDIYKYAFFGQYKMLKGPSWIAHNLQA